MDKIGISLIVPCYNEAPTIEEQVDRCFQAVQPLAEPFEFLVINDASTDSSAKILDRLADKYSELSVIHHDKNQGIASTLSELYDWANQEYVINFSFDGEWEANDLARLIATREMADIIVGKRQTKHYSLYRAMVSQIYNDFPKVIFGVATYDAGSIKLIPQKALKAARPTSKSVFADAERLILAQKAGFSITSIPIEHYAGEKQKRFGGRPIVILRSFMDMMRLWTRMYIPRRPPR